MHKNLGYCAYANFNIIVIVLEINHLYNLVKFYASCVSLILDLYFLGDTSNRRTIPRYL